MESEPVWIKFIKSITDANNNFLALTVGPTGSGKSYSNLAIAEMLDPELYKHPERINFSPRDTLHMIRKIGIPPGKPYITEEAGIQMDKQKWQSLNNKVMKYLMQTYRYMNLVALFNVPSVSYIDSSVYKLFDAQWETQGIDIKSSKCYIKPFLLEYNEKYDKTYYKFLQTKIGEFNEPITLWAIPKPSDRLIRIYEAKKKAFNLKLQDNLLLEIEASERKMDKRRALTDKQQAYYDLRLEGLNNNEACDKMGINAQMGTNHKQAIEKKGYSTDFAKKTYESRKINYKSATEPV